MGCPFDCHCSMYNCTWYSLVLVSISHSGQLVRKLVRKVLLLSSESSRYDMVERVREVKTCFLF